MWHQKSRFESNRNCTLNNLKMHIYCTLQTKQNIWNQYLQKLTLSSKAAIPIPVAAAVPANPMKWPDPILLANKDAPTYRQILNVDIDKQYFTKKKQKWYWYLFATSYRYEVHAPWSQEIATYRISFAFPRRLKWMTFFIRIILLDNVVHLRDTYN